MHTDRAKRFSVDKTVKLLHYYCYKYVLTCKYVEEHKSSKTGGWHGESKGRQVHQWNNC